MRVDILHKCLIRDVTKLQQALKDVLPPVLPTKYQHRSINLRSFLKQLNAQTEPLGVHSRTTYDKDVERGSMQHSAFWYPKELLPHAGSHCDIHIRWHIHKWSRIRWTPEEWQRRRYFFWQFLMHELIHRYQGQWRAKYVGAKSDSLHFAPAAPEHKNRDEQIYLGDFDEVETFAFMAALEFHTWWQFPTKSEYVHAAYDCIDEHVTPTYQYYTSAFDQNAPVVRRFRRKVWMWHQLMTAEPTIQKLLHLPKLV